MKAGRWYREGWRGRVTTQMALRRREGDGTGAEGTGEVRA